MKSERKDLLERFEALLGDPLDEQNPLGFAQVVALDSREEFPEKALEIFDRIGLTRFLVPRELGGDLEDFEQLLEVSRVIGRRDLTAAVAKGKCILGALPIWMFGTPEQKARVSEIVLHGGLLSLGLTERKNGSDLMLTSMEAKGIAKSSDEAEIEAYLLSGEKWLINNATRCKAMTVLVRTSAQGGLRGLSLFLFDKENCLGNSDGRSGATPLPKIKLHGVRGMDVNGLLFQNVRIEPQALLGKKGHGLEMALKVLQVSRVLASSFCLGAAETVLSVVKKFCLERQLYGSTIYEMPVVRSRLVCSQLDYMQSEILLRVYTRAIHLLPEQMSVYSAIAKFRVPELTERLVHRSCVTLGARSFLREEFMSGIVEKIRRDVAIVGLFDGSTQVNLYVLASQLRALCLARNSASFDRRCVEGLVNASRLPAVDYGKINLTNRGQDDIMNWFVDLAAGGINRYPRLVSLVNAKEMVENFVLKLKVLDRQVLESPTEEKTQTAKFFSFAERYTLLHSAAILVLCFAHDTEISESAIRLMLDDILLDLDSFSDESSSLQEPFSENLNSEQLSSQSLKSKQSREKLNLRLSFAERESLIQNFVL